MMAFSKDSEEAEFYWKSMQIHFQHDEEENERCAANTLPGHNLSSKNWVLTIHLVDAFVFLCGIVCLSIYLLDSTSLSVIFLSGVWKMSVVLNKTVKRMGQFPNDCWNQLRRRRQCLYIIAGNYFLKHWREDNGNGRTIISSWASCWRFWYPSL